MEGVRTENPPQGNFMHLLMSGSVVEFVTCFVTVGKGMEDFATQELIEMGMTACERCSEGKVMFTCPSQFLYRLHFIKTAERLFVLVDYRSNLLAKRDKDQAVQQLFDLFRTRITGWEQRRQECEWIRNLSPTNPITSKKRKLEDNEASQEKKVRFRVCCKISSGRMKVEEASRSIGSAVSLAAGWTPELRYPDYELCVTLNRTQCLSGISVMHAPLSLRAYIRYAGLRAPTCAAMSRLLALEQGQTVLDPMCGTAALLIETAIMYPTCTCIGIDTDPGQVCKARENVRAAALSHRVHIIMADATCLPVREVDAVVCDLPFGQKYSNGDDVRKLLPKVVENIFRLVRPGGRCIYLISREREGLLIGTIGAQSLPAQLKSSHPVCLGTLPATIIVYEKTNEKQ